MMAIIACIEMQANHPLAKAITEFIQSKRIEALRNLQITNVPSNGLKSIIDGEEILLGKPDSANLHDAEDFQGRVLDHWANEGGNGDIRRQRHR